MNKIDVTPTVAVIVDMADTLRKYSNELDKIAKKMYETNDISIASDAVNSFMNCIQNCRLDLLVTRPIREFNRTVGK